MSIKSQGEKQGREKRAVYFNICHIFHCQGKFGREREREREEEEWKNIRASLAILFG
jgi:hypothetical protein